MLNKFHSKKAAAVIGDTMTWVIATIIIIIMLIVFIFVSSLFAETKSISKYRAKLISNNFYEGSDSFLTKSLFSYYQIKESRVQSEIYLILQDLEAREGFSESLETRNAEIKARLLG